MMSDDELAEENVTMVEAVPLISLILFLLPRPSLNPVFCSFAFSFSRLQELRYNY